MFLQHALRPILEYMAEFYQPPPNIVTDIYPPLIMYKNICHETSKHDIRPEIASLTNDLLAGRIAPSGGVIHSTKMLFRVPKDAQHPFWSQTGISLEDGQFVNSIPMEITAYGSSRDEANNFALLKLLKYVELVRYIMHHCTKPTPFNFTPFRKVTTATTILDPCYIRSDIQCNAMTLASQLLSIYKSRKGILINGKGWDAIYSSMREYMRIYPELKSLILYYLVFSFWKEVLILKRFSSIFV
jgi:hypothetical protein